MAETAIHVYGIEEGRHYLERGTTYTTERTFTHAAHARFVELSGDDNEIHRGNDAVIHGMALLVWASAVAGTKFPGQGTHGAGLDKVRWLRPVYVGDRVTLTFTVEQVRGTPEGQVAKLSARFHVKDRKPAEQLVARGEFTALVPH